MISFVKFYTNDQRTQKHADPKLKIIKDYAFLQQESSLQQAADIAFLSVAIPFLQQAAFCLQQFFSSFEQLPSLQQDISLVVVAAIFEVLSY